METKMFEVRDRSTFIPVLAICPGGRYSPAMSTPERHLWGRAGYGTTLEALSGYVLLARIVGGETDLKYDPYSWDMSRGRSMSQAHVYIGEHWDELTSGDVIDVEFILGETAAPKVSERLRNG